MSEIFENLTFKLNTLLFRFRDLFKHRIDTLLETDLRSGLHVLDYGCSYGSYTIIAAKMVGPNGKVYALDSHRSAIDLIQKLAIRKSLNNIQPILSDGTIGLSNATVDVVLLHELSFTDSALREMHRVLRPHCFLYFSDHQIYIRDNEIVSKLTNTGLFRLYRKATKAFSFIKIG